MSDATLTGDDPTVQGTLPGTVAERYSPSEIEALSRKAARGAGYDWGLAEEAGRAARALAGYGLPGAEVLADLLRRVAGTPYAALRPVSTATEGVWRAEADAPLCPIIAGAALSDRGHEIVAGGAFTLGPTACPLLASAFMGRLAERATEGYAERHAERTPREPRVPLVASWNDVSLRFLADGLVVDGNAASLRTASAERVTFRPDRTGRSATSPLLRSEPLSRHVDPAAWRVLEGFASRTYAPASERSRAGAGAGTSDRD